MTEVREFTLGNGTKLNFKKHPRYGTWSVGFDRGGVPAKLQGQFLSFEDLYEKATYYLENRRDNPTEIVDGKKRRNSSGKQPDSGTDHRGDGAELS